MTTELVRLRKAADTRPWNGNDLLDLSFLGPATVYCDVVVTERQWASFVERAGFEARYGTQVIFSLRELAPLLV